jgi:hypothetical protein
VSEEDGDEDEDGDVKMDAPVLRFGPPKRHSSGHVKSVTHDNRQDAADATFTSSVDGNIFIFVTINFF